MEGLEPVCAALPASFHGKDNVLYMAAHEIRSLESGEAFVNCVGQAENGVGSPPRARGQVPQAFR
jgi:hypothetical protein